LLIETCEHCCSILHDTGYGNPYCFDNVWTFEKCCNDDYKGLVCEIDRKGEEGGCVDCKKTISYTCLTPIERALRDIQKKYNLKVDAIQELERNIHKQKQTIYYSQVDYQEKEQAYHQAFAAMEKALHVYTGAMTDPRRLALVH
jgi:hypothetical protein